MPFLSPSGLAVSTNHDQPSEIQSPDDKRVKRFCDMFYVLYP